MPFSKRSSREGFLTGSKFFFWIKNERKTIDFKQTERKKKNWISVKRLCDSTRLFKIQFTNRREKKVFFPLWKLTTSLGIDLISFNFIVCDGTSSQRGSEPFRNKDEQRCRRYIEIEQREKKFCASTQPNHPYGNDFFPLFRHINAVATKCRITFLSFRFSTSEF